MYCRLLLPRLPAADLPTLRLIGARGQRLAAPPEEAEAWLCAAFGIPRQNDWPVAPWSLLGEGIDPGDAYWLCADPVNLRLMRNHLILFGGPQLAVSADEAQHWRDALEQHFATDGLSFLAPHPHRWYLRLADRQGPHTHSLTQVLGREIRPFLPQGPVWLKLLNEIQMLLHADPRNTAREEQGRATVNSVWLWGGGIRLEMPHAPCPVIYADAPLAKGLANATAATLRALPANADECLSSDADCLIVATGQTPDTLEQRWLLPLKNALAKGRIKKLEVIAPGNQSVEISRLDLWKFWRNG